MEIFSNRKELKTFILFKTFMDGPLIHILKLLGDLITILDGPQELFG